MNKKNIILVVLLILVVVLAVFAIFVGMQAINSNDSNTNNDASQEEKSTFYLTLDDMYCNVKDSKKIVLVNLSIEVYGEEGLDTLNAKSYLIRDNINQIIRNKDEKELEGKEGQVKLKEEIKASLIDLFDDNLIANVYFNDFVMQ